MNKKSLLIMAFVVIGFVSFFLYEVTKPVMPEVNIPEWDALDPGIKEETGWSVQEWIQFLSKYKSARKEYVIYKKNGGTTRRLKKKGETFLAVPIDPDAEKIASYPRYQIGFELKLPKTEELPEPARSALLKISSYYYSISPSEKVELEDSKRNLSIIFKSFDNSLPVGAWKKRNGGFYPDLFIPDNISKYNWKSELISYSMLDPWVSYVAPGQQRVEILTQPFMVSANPALEGKEIGDVKIIYFDIKTKKGGSK